MAFPLPRGFALAALIGCLAACSGGTSSSPAPRPSPSATGNGTPLLNQRITFTITVPAPATLARELKNFRRRAATPSASPSPSSGAYISPGIGSITIGLVEVNGVSLKVPPAASGPVNAPAGCASAGCTFSVPSVVAAVGTNYYAVQTFTGPNATGKPISSALVFVPVTGSGAVDTTLGDPTQLSAGGYVYGLNVVAAPASFVAGTLSSVSLLVTATDATGATLVGNVQYFSAVTLTASGTGVTLVGPGLTSSGTIVLEGPQPATPPLFAVYNGALGASAASVAAATTDGDGNAVASSVSIGFATPTAMPGATPTPGPTATPAAGSTPPPGPPDSVYVINAATNGVAEFADPSAGVDPAPRRLLGGASIACTGAVNAQYVDPGILALSVDAAGTVTVASGAQAVCGGQSLTFSRFGAAAMPADPPATAISSNLPNALVELKTDPLSTTAVYESDDSGGSTNAIEHLDLSGAVPGGMAAAGLLAPEFGQQQSGGGNNCIESTGRPLSGTPLCADPNQFSYASTGSVYEPFVRLDDGTLAAVALDDNYQGAGSNTAIVFLPPQVPSPNVPDQAGPVWISSAAYLTPYVISLAYDATTHLIYAMFDDAQGAGNCTVPGDTSQQCPDNVSHLYVEAFDYRKIQALVAQGQTGAVDLTPTFTLGGIVPGKFGLPANTSVSIGAQLPNLMAAANGRLYIANIFPNGYCDASCQAGGSASLAYPYSGQIDIYDVASLSGYHVGDTAPIATISNMPGFNDALAVPVGVAVGPTGSVVSTARFRPNRAARFFTPRQRAAILRLRELRLRRERSLRTRSGMGGPSF